VSVLGGLLVAVTPQAAHAVQTAQPSVVNAKPATYTPDVNDGTVFAIGQVGSSVFIGGLFTSVSPHGSTSSYPLANIAEFTAGTGALVNSFAPSINGQVNSIMPGPKPGTVYVAGQFTKVNGVTTKLALLDTTTGAIVPGWKPPAFGALINKIVLADGQLFVAGNFTTVGTQVRDGLATLNPTTGALTTYSTVAFTGHHNFGVHCTVGKCANGAVGVKALDVDPAGTHLVAIGNFTSADGNARDQVAVLNLGATSATVDADWATAAYTAACFSNSFDSYIRDVQFSPDGSYFVIVATGGSGTNSDGTNSSCDTAARYETDGSGSNVRPTWITYTGQDSFWSVALTGSVVYVGGHERWVNNSHGFDKAAEGAVPRPGIAGLDPVNGMPLAWNPGRSPRGAGAYALLATSDGLYVGSDTDYIGNRLYLHKKISFFPLAGGETLASQATPALPGRVYASGPRSASAATGVLYRIDAGGPAIAATDDGPDWQADQSDPSPYRNSGSTTASYSAVAHVDTTVPSTTPSAIFNTERSDPGRAGDGNEMQWTLPVPAGVTVSVRLFFANRSTSTNRVGQRSFDVTVDGQTFLSKYDIVAAAGDQTGHMAVDTGVVSAGAVTIGFTHRVNNPVVDGIEILQTDPAPTQAPDPTSLTERRFDGTTAHSPQTISAGIDWSGTRGAFMLNGELYYGRTDGYLYERTFNGATFGPETKIDPYDDPTWDNIKTGSGQTYQGVQSALAAELPTVTSMFFSGGRVYYTNAGSSSMHWRWFEPDSGVVGSDEFTVNDGENWSHVAGAFLSGSTLYYADSTTGNLMSVGWSSGAASGTPTTVDTSQNWAARGLFLLDDATTPNQAPAANFTASCSSVTTECTFDASTSTDPDGAVSDYSWTFNGSDPQDDQGSPTATFDFQTPGIYHVSLTVTDNDGASTTSTQKVAAGVAVAAPAFRDLVTGCGVGKPASCSSTTTTLPIPADVAVGDGLLMFVTYANNSVTNAAPAGWTLLGTAASGAGGLESDVYYRSADASDAGSQVSVDFSAAVRNTVTIADYTGVDLTSAPVFKQATDAATTNHTSPSGTIPGGGGFPVTFWADKSSATTSWTPPAAVTSRATSFGTGSGFVTSLLADAGTPAPAGGYGGLVATTNDAAARGASWTIVLSPAG
jgi:hypothetical protein